MALAFALVQMTGCREAPPPPAQGWARLSALVALHPQIRVLNDIDRRLKTLDGISSKVADRPAAQLPPPAITQSLPAKPALPGAGPAYAPDTHTLQMNLRDLQAYRRELMYEMERAYVRQERKLHLEAEEALRHAVAELEAAYDADTRDIAEAFRLSIRRGEIRSEVAWSEYAKATDFAEKAKRAAERHPDDVKAREAAKNALERAKEQQEQARKITQRLEQYRREYNQQLDKARETLEQAIRDTREASRRRIADQLAQFRKTMEASIEKNITEEAARLAEEAKRPPEGPTMTPITFPSIPEHLLAVSTAEMAGAFARDADGRYQGQELAVSGINSNIEELRRIRGQVAAAIDADTRAAAISLAAAHHYDLTFDSRAGEDITGDMRQWLKAYWGHE